MQIQGVFAYSQHEVDQLEVSISLERLQPYYLLAQGNREQALRLYEWNTSLSESLYGVLQALEIALRNAIQRSLENAYGQANWYSKAHLQREQMLALMEAEQRVRRSKGMVQPGRMVAELHLGFWVSLLGPAYAQSLWDRHLHSAFTARLGRKAVYARFQSVRKLRNRVAHHESILG